MIEDEKKFPKTFNVLEKLSRHWRLGEGLSGCLFFIITSCSQRGPLMLVDMTSHLDPSVLNFADVDHPCFDFALDCVTTKAVIEVGNALCSWGRFHNPRLKTGTLRVSPILLLSFLN